MLFHDFQIGYHDVHAQQKQTTLPRALRSKQNDVTVQVTQTIQANQSEELHGTLIIIVIDYNL